MEYTICMTLSNYVIIVHIYIYVVTHNLWGKNIQYNAVILYKPTNMNMVNINKNNEYSEY